MRTIVIIGGSDVGITTGLRVRELDKEAKITIITNNRFPNYSICGIPFLPRRRGEALHGSSPPDGR